MKYNTMGKNTQAGYLSEMYAYFLHCSMIASFTTMEQNQTLSINVDVNNATRNKQSTIQ